MNNYTYMTGGQDVRTRKGFYVGSSDIASILGLSSTTPHQWWREHTGRDEPFAGNEATEWGHKLEGLILETAIREEAGLAVSMKFFLDYARNMYHRAPRWRPKTAYEPYTEAIHPDLPWLLAHADCIYNPGEKNFEAKSGRRFANLRRDDMDGYDPKDPTASGVPFRVYFQTQLQTACYGIKETDVLALIDTNNYSTYQIDANPKIQARLIEAASRMMYCLERDVEPTPKTFGDIQHMFPELNNERLTIMGEKAAIGWDLKERRKKAATKEKRAKGEKEDCTNALALLIGENVELVDELGNKICTQSKYEQDNMLSPKKIKESSPEAFELLDAAGMITKSDRRRINA